MMTMMMVTMMNGLMERLNQNQRKRRNEVQDRIIRNSNLKRNPRDESRILCEYYYSKLNYKF